MANLLIESENQLLDEIRDKLFGQSVRKMTYLMNTRYPLAWEFYFWKLEGQWLVVNVRITNEIDKVFN